MTKERLDEIRQRYSQYGDLGIIDSSALIEGCDFLLREVARLRKLAEPVWPTTPQEDEFWDKADHIASAGKMVQEGT